MIRRLLFGRVMSWALLAMVALAVWQSYRGDPIAITDRVWALLQSGADVVTNVWHRFIESGSAPRGSSTGSSV